MTLVLMLALFSADPGAVDPRAEALRTQARAALGGEAAAGVVRTLSLEGHFRRIPPPDTGGREGTRPSRGRFGRESSGDLTLEIAVPDKMRREESVAMGSGPSFTTTAGLDGDHAWMGTEGASPGGRFGGRGGPGGGGGDAAPASDRLARTPEERKAREEQFRTAMGRRLHDELARMLLGLLAVPGEGASLAYGGQAESPDGRADVLDVTTAGSEKARVFLDATTHLPLMVTYQETMTFSRRPSEAAPRTLDVTLFFSDRATVGGVALPKRISRAVNGAVVEEWEVARWRVNPTLKPERFQKQ
jgi:hypothetical protein